jgi:hypothetical protein
MIDDPGAMSGLLRAVEVRARRDERTRLAELLTSAAEAREEGARSHMKRPRATGAWKAAQGIRRALELVAGERGEWATEPGDPIGSVVNDCDAIELYVYDPRAEDDGDEPDPMPIRLVVSDGADGAVATAYLSRDDATDLRTFLDLALEVTA